MLGKLLKYDFKAIGRTMLPIYALLLVSSLGVAITMAVGEGTVVGIIRIVLLITFGISIGVTVIGTFIMLLLDYYRTLFTDRGYLTFSLPVKVSQIFTSKLLNGAIWTFLSVVVSFVAIYGVSYSYLPDNIFGRIFGFFGELMAAANACGVSYFFMVMLIIVSIITLLFGAQSMIFFCITLGQQWRNHRVLGAFLTALGLYIINQIVSITGIVRVGELIVYNDMLEVTVPSMLDMVTTAGTAFMVITLVEMALEIVLSNVLLKKKLNLE